MDSRYVHVFSGSMIEANKLIYDLSEKNIDPSSKIEYIFFSFLFKCVN